MNEKRGPGTILVVDDSPTNIKLMLDHLSSYGFKVLIAQDGSSAIEQAKLAKPNLILLDVMMPGMDGFETCKGLKRDSETKDIPVIFLTAISESINKVQGFEAGAVDYITKPFNFDEMLARVNTQMTIGSLQKNLQTTNLLLKQEIADRKKLEKDLRNAQSHLIQSEKLAALGKLTAGISHEINTPAAVVKSSVDILTRCVHRIDETLKIETTCIASEVNSDYRKTLKVLKSNCLSATDATDRILKIVSSLKKFVQLDQAHLHKIDINEGLDNTLTLMQSEFKEGTQIVRNYTQLPQIYGDGAEINQAFMTILRNASEAIGGVGTITIKTITNKSHIHIVISDTGKGMSQRKLEKLFELNFTSKGSRVGMGMGLFNAYNIMQKHHGDLTVQSEIGQGSTFTMILPVELER